MTREQFESFLEAPGQIGIEQVPELKSMLNEFPYCQTTRLLYVAGLRNQKSISFDDQLNLMAAYSPDRKSLYYLINPVIAGEENEALPEEALREEESVTIEGEMKTPDKTTPQAEEIPAPTEAEEPEVEEKEQGQEVNMAAPLDLTDTDERPLEEYVLSENHLQELVGTSLIFDLEETFGEEKALPGKEEKEAAVVPEEKNEKHDFSEWLGIFNKDRKEKTVSQKELIENFLTQAPNIRVQVKPDAPALNLARKSTVASDEFITETLAKIHVEQGHISKAVEIYEKLSLKYPEKRSYFAAQIKFLKQKP